MDVSLRLAKSILNGFESFFADFQNLTLAARAGFESADWATMQSAAAERYDLRKVKSQQLLRIAEIIAGPQLRERALWEEAKNHYTNLINEHHNFEIAETFFNTIYCKVFKHYGIRNDVAFVATSRAKAPTTSLEELCVHFTLEGDVAPVVRAVLQHFSFSIPYEDLERDVRHVTTAIECEVLPELIDSDWPVKVQFLRSVFYRNKGAYLVGRFVAGDYIVPWVMPILNNEHGGVYVDTALFTSDELSIVFSFTRSYFMVDAEIPSQYVDFLRTLMPHKPLSELYSSMGFNKHGKTEFFRSAVRHKEATTDQYIIAPGIKGMVMAVFTLESYGYVFKIIKDRFTPPKEMTREQVMAKYNLVKRWDRAGRMADTQEFHNLAFDVRRFSKELLDELHAVCPSQLEQRGNALIIRHCYVERRMTPLNLYLSDCSDEQLTEVMDEYGNAIKQLAAANIFPGDMLLKNFGVTRHGRVVFYDYDEIMPLTDCVFREIPEPKNEEQAMSTEPWYSIGPNDIFPEEFRLFFSGNRRAHQVFDQLHSDIYEASFWRTLQDRIRAGYVEDCFPYRRRKRFPRTGHESEGVLLTPVDH